MAIVKLKSVSGSNSVGNKQTYTNVYRVELDEGESGVNDVFASPDLPRKFDPYPGNRRAVVKSINPASVEGGIRTFDVTVNYDTEPISEADKAKDEAEKPTERPVQVEWDSYTISEVAEEDFSDPPLPYATANDEVFDPAPEREIKIAVLRMTRCEENEFDGAKILKYGNTVNRSTWRGAEPGYLKLVPPKSTKKTEGDDVYWEVRYEFHYHPQSWKRRILHQGYRVRVDCEGEDCPEAGYKIVTATDDDGRDESKPVLLDEDGYRLEVGGTPVYLERKDFKEEDWGPLDLEDA